VIYISGRLSPDVKQAWPVLIHNFCMDVKWEVVTTCINLLFSCAQVIV